jgi:ATP-dependent helicase Lhr and Lhr-like helicase
VFPDQAACIENMAGRREIPDHPLVQQTFCDCLSEAMDIEGLERLLREIARGETRIIARDLTEPSPLAQEILNAKPYAFLDDAPLEERRTRAVVSRRWLDPASATDLGRLDPEAIERVRRETWPEADTADELQDAPLTLGFVHEAEGQATAPGRAFRRATRRRPHHGLDRRRACASGPPSSGCRRSWPYSPKP